MLLQVNIFSHTARKYPFSEKEMAVTGPACPSNLATFAYNQLRKVSKQIQ